MKKKTIKINFKYFGALFNPEDNFFTNILKKMYNVEISQDPDYVFYSVYPEVRRETKDLSKKGDFVKKISPRLYIFLRKLYSKFNLLFVQDKAKVPKGKFIKIFFGAEHVKPNMKECDWAFSSYFEEDINDPRYMRIPVYMISDYKLKNFGAPPFTKKINFNKLKNEKTKFCNFIYSQEIPKRNELFKLINTYKKVDSPGRCMNNMHSISYNTPKESRFSVNWVEEKLNFLKPYKFTISFENSMNSGYTSEKLTQPMLVNSIPIYVGHKDVSKEFNTKSFINYSDFKNMKDFLDFIIKVDKDDKLYEKMLKEPWYNGNSLLNYKSKLLKRFREIFG